MTSFAHHKTALLKSIQREWDALMLTVEKLTPEQMAAPDAGGWSPKDNLCHLTQWLKVLIGFHIDHKSGVEVIGITTEMDENFNFQRVNEFLFDRNKDRSAEDIIAEFKAEFASTMARLESMPFEDLLKPRHNEDPRQEPLLNWVLGNTTDHFKEHRETIEKAIR